MRALRQIGTTDVQVTDISFGASAIGNLGRAVSDEETTAVLQSAWDAGIRYFDTAPHYGRGRSEERLGRFLKSKPREDYVLSTKVGRVLSPGPTLKEADGFIDPLPNDVRYDYSGDGIEASLEGSFERLQTHYADIVYIHDIGTYTHGAANEKHMQDLLVSGLDRLQRLKDRGKIRAFGIGVNETQVCLDLLTETDLDAILLAGRLTLLDREAEDGLVEKCRQRGTSLVLGGIFNSGILATGPVEGAWFDYAPASQEILEKVTALKAQAEGMGLSLASAALHFAHSYPGVASVLLGTSKVTSLKRNLDSLATKPPADFSRMFGSPPIGSLQANL
ncbi:probable L-fucose dehydrogenase protein [Stappia aggregata IAM 12614]|uniref:Probable L-fucose dehydrogenase protein n=1 Tax=Roseibium aggregatum (strain ATCC 25650 / DSM 13394 / JCM 20685 / NBRC 16684 / NCIMB 2208 / IAM 12614 / B1) TaxID=384765 RepID=A0P099_ROSAI|nr:aldo/keto reductase [Roseibium aggregatum]EAV41507.1 probable L-fucose dehydrogenase protein [Stappia aggregata IAM 12614] [Roseibium aggregatum IAM 12614]